jgi:hypothetical protein
MNNSDVWFSPIVVNGYTGALTLTSSEVNGIRNRTLAKVKVLIVSTGLASQNQNITVTIKRNGTTIHTGTVLFNSGQCKGEALLDVPDTAFDSDDNLTMFVTFPSNANQWGYCSALAILHDTSEASKLDYTIHPQNIQDKTAQKIAYTQYSELFNNYPSGTYISVFYGMIADKNLLFNDSASIQFNGNNKFLHNSICGYGYNFYWDSYTGTMISDGTDDVRSAITLQADDSGHGRIWSWAIFRKN